MQAQSEKAANPTTPFTPRLATTYEGGDPAFLEKVAPLVDYIEVVPDTISESKNGIRSISNETLTELKNICRDIPIIAHGIGLSIGSHEGYSQDYLRLLDQLLETVDIAWHSEHLGYTTVDGVNLGTMLPMPTTEQTLEILCERTREIQQRYGIPFLLENVAHVLPVFSDNYSPAEFMNALAKQSGCYLLLDIYNLECDAHNHALDIEKFLDELNLDSVWEIHVANGVEHRNMRLDVHSELTRQSTLDITSDVLSSAASVRAVTYELLSQAIPILGHQAIADELQRIRTQVIDGH
jgi:uncharacterized protein (UPF0276 family)